MISLVEEVEFTYGRWSNYIWFFKLCEMIVLITAKMPNKRFIKPTHAANEHIRHIAPHLSTPVRPYTQEEHMVVVCL